MTKPLVSVVIVCYNHANFVNQCVESVFNQTYSNLEIFVVDNGSADGSSQVIEQSSYRHRFEFIANPRMTLVKSLNAIKGTLNGKYVSIVAADDWWKPNKIELQVEFMETHLNCGVSTGLAATVDQLGNIVDNPSIENDTPKFFSFEQILLTDFTLRACVAIHRKAALDAVGWYDENFEDEDYYMYLRMTDNNWSAALIPVVVGYYRSHNSNISKNYRFVHEQVSKIINLYSDHPLYIRAISKFNAWIFSVLASHDKYSALKLLPKLYINKDSFSNIFVGLLRLIIPSFFFGIKTRIITAIKRNV